ncbi:hypothetical protein PQJ75_29660 [Rhodoplanes sp. TEM]|uniref:Uncharacterized protein n=1 Tax=Rhodoplanes tepidamans TaxID=200616 RepID=A0ABT5JBJ2_RHOTP|nr:MULTISPECIES: hypothetical protein [Rhodoplanes]MDC7787051.1 hypothetical protein [Rhodoplanes tepidamans]MDC7987921.1 hypothetical protein [Rhodoplanes sp. TEM]MDQ0359061.1 hypothetical protein [Rhodoplanes tepidamans]
MVIEVQVREGRVRTGGARRCGPALAVMVAALLGGCANGDFGRVKPGLVRDGIHDWMGPAAAKQAGLPVSAYPYTEDERVMRDLAFPLIEPPYERQRWYSILEEYGVTRGVRQDWVVFNVAAYEQHLMQTAFRSATARYSKLNDDIRNDVNRLPAWVAAARRVLDMDIKRGKSLAHVNGLTSAEAGNAQARMAENALIMSWVQQSLVNRTASYGYALERLVIATPLSAAVEVERSLTFLKTRVAEARLLPGPEITPGAIVLVPPYPLPSMPPITKSAPPPGLPLPGVPSAGLPPPGPPAGPVASAAPAVAADPAGPTFVSLVRP